MEILKGIGLLIVLFSVELLLAYCALKLKKENEK